MATQWNPRFEQSQHQWLLTNGEIVKAPAMEETPSGRKVRIIGTSLDGYAKDIDTVMLTGVAKVAESRGAKIWMRFDEDATAVVFAGHLGFDYRNEGAQQLHILGRSQENGARTVLWWRYVHPDYPLGAIVSLVLRAEKRSYAPLASQQMRSGVSFQVAVAGMPDSIAARYHDGTREIVDILPLDYNAKETARGYYRTNPLSIDGLFKTSDTTSERAAVKQLLDHVRTLDDIEEIELPDLRDADAPGVLTFRLDSTNVTGEFIDTLIQYLDSAPTLEQAAHHYEQLLITMRQMGMVLAPKTENDFLSAMLAGEGMTIVIEAHDETNGGVHTAKDSRHTVSLAMSTGTVVVNCDHRTNHDDIAHAWAEAKTIASLTGEEDELLGYAKAYNNKVNKERADRIIGLRAAAAV